MLYLSFYAARGFNVNIKLIMVLNNTIRLAHSGKNNARNPVFYAYIIGIEVKYTIVLHNKSLFTCVK